jgi:transposase
VEAPPFMDANAVWSLLLAERARHAAELEERDLKLAAQDDARATDQELIARLSRIIRDLQRAAFRARSEKLDPDQLALALEDLQQDLAAA